MSARLPFLFTVLFSSNSPLLQGTAGPGMSCQQTHQTAASVLVWGDFDRDGRQDAYAVQPRGQDRLLRNLGDGSFEDVTDQAFLGASFSSRSAAWTDVDGDGWIDLYVASIAGGSRLFQNLGDGAFAERTREAGLSDVSAEQDVWWFDYDGDGRADLVLKSPGGELLLHNRGDWTFERAALPLPITVDPVDPSRGDAAVPESSEDTPARTGNVSRDGSDTPSAYARPFSATGPTMTGLVALPRGPGLPVIGVPPGFMILGDTQSAPSGYTSTGWQLDVLTGPQLWMPKGSLPTARTGLAAAAINQKIYAIGGHDGVSPLTTVEEYDPATDTWTSKASMPTARHHLAAVALNGINKIYAIGGQDPGTNLGTVEEYDPASNTWTSKASMPTGRHSLAAAALNGKIYAIGGQGAGGYLGTIEEYNPASNAWTSRASMAAARSGLAAAGLGGKIYAIGGYDGLSDLGSVEAYDPLNNSWTFKAPMAQTHVDLVAAELNAKIYAIGGQNPGGYLGSVEEYNPVSDSWTSKVAMPTARIFFGAAVASGKIYAVGGTDGITCFLDTVEEYDPAIRTLYLHRKN